MELISQSQTNFQKPFIQHTILCTSKSQKANSIKQFKYSHRVSVLPFGITIQEFQGKLQQIRSNQIQLTPFKFLELLIKLSNRLKFKKITLDLSFLENLLSEQLFHKLMCSLTKMRHIRALGVSVFVGISLSRQGFLQFAHQVQNFKSLSCLGVDFIKCENADGKVLTKLGNSISMLKRKLTKLHFSFSDVGDRVTAPQYESFYNSLESLSKLTNLRVLILFNNMLTDQDIRGLPSLLLGLEKLESIQLSFSFSSVTSEGPTKILEAASQCEQLNSLDLDLTGCEEINDDFLTSLQLYLKEKKGDLTMFDVTLHQCSKISQDILDYIDGQFDRFSSKMEKLEVLCAKSQGRLDRFFSSKSNLKVVNFMKQVNLMSQLKRLSFFFGYNINLTSQDILNISESLRGLTNLRDLNLSLFANSKIGDTDVGAIFGSLGTLKNIKLLIFNFSECQKLTDQAMVYLKESCSNMKSPSSMIVNLSKCNKITDEGIIHFGAFISSLTQLYTLGVVFYGCDKITEQGMITFGKALECLKSLNDITFDFSVERSSRLQNFVSRLGAIKNLIPGVKSQHQSQVKVTEAIKTFVESISKVKRLHRLTLGFRGYEQLNDDEFKLILQQVQKMRYLRILDFDLQSCRSLTNESVNQIRRVGRKMPYLQQMFLLFLKCDQITSDTVIELKEDVQVASSIVVGVGEQEFHSRPIFSLQFHEILLSLTYQF